jgi:excisionase family DNA binding protein
MTPIALTVADTVNLLGLGKTTVYRLIGEGRLAKVKVGRRTLILMESVNELLAVEPRQ